MFYVKIKSANYVKYMTECYVPIMFIFLRVYTGCIMYFISINVEVLWLLLVTTIRFVAPYPVLCSCHAGSDHMTCLFVFDLCIFFVLPSAVTGYLLYVSLGPWKLTCDFW
jgi:hypothetical protein